MWFVPFSSTAILHLIWKKRWTAVAHAVSVPHSTFCFVRLSLFFSWIWNIPKPCNFIISPFFLEPSHCVYRQHAGGPVSRPFQACLTFPMQGTLVKARKGDGDRRHRRWWQAVSSVQRKMFWICLSKEQGRGKEMCRRLITACTLLLPDDIMCKSLAQGSSQRNNIPSYHVTTLRLWSSFRLTALPAIEIQKQLLCKEVATEIWANLFSENSVFLQNEWYCISWEVTRNIVLK